MRLTKIDILVVSFVAPGLLSSVMALAQSDYKVVTKNFVGTWKQNEAKGTLGSIVPLRFRRAADGSLEELRGPEARPVIHPVKFGIPAYKVPDSRYTIAWRQIDSEHFERQLFDDGRLTMTRNISLSGDGRTATEVIHLQAPDGKESTTTFAYIRSSGDPQGLVGVWKVESLRTSEPLELRIEPVGANALRFAGRVGNTVTLTLDGKPAAIRGPAVITNLVSSAKILRANAIEETTVREGIITSATIWEVSEDGKTLTSTEKRVGATATDQPTVIVYERQ
jgi:hypothetical protein